MSEQESCVHFRFKLQGGYDFQAVALEASSGQATFEQMYNEQLSAAESGYFETSQGMFKIEQLQKPVLSDKPGFLTITYVSSPDAAVLSDQEFDYLIQKKAALRERHKQLQTMNETGTKSLISLYTLMLLYAAAPFTGVRSAFTNGFFRVWGLGGIWLALTAWFYCERAFWKYGNHLFEQIFCVRQLHQMDKAVIGRSKLHNLYAILPSYGYSWDRLPSRITPSDDPSRLTDRRVQAAAWFFVLVNFFPLMHFCLFLSLLLFPLMMTDAKIDPLGIYLRVALGSSFVFFLWLGRTMNSFADLMQAVFRARRIGVESPWPEFPDVDNLNVETWFQKQRTRTTVRKWLADWPSRTRMHKLRDETLTILAILVSIINLAIFLWWAFPQIQRPLPAFARGTRWIMTAVTITTFVVWMWFKRRAIKARISFANELWPSAHETRHAKVTRRGLNFFLFRGPVGWIIDRFLWVVSG